MMMNIAIIGTRGIPNYYGGFEQFAEYLSVGLVERGYNVTVYNSSVHPFQGNEWNGVRLVHCNDPEDKLGTVGQFIYDYNCIKHARKQQYDIILQLGYTSSSVWGWMLPRKRSIVTTNMDGLEWKRTKYSRPVRTFLKFAERLGVWFSDYLISDSVGIQEHLKRTYAADSVYIPYGATSFTQANSTKIEPYGICEYQYNMLIARLEPENSIEIILDGVCASSNQFPFLVVGKHETKYGEYLKRKYRKETRIQFLGGIYDIEILNNLRYFSNLYFHGHTVGGTNPSLLEAMASSSLICANENVFNHSILGDDAYYFKSASDVSGRLDCVVKSDELSKVENNAHKVKNLYLWDQIVDSYQEHFQYIYNQRNK